MAKAFYAIFRVNLAMGPIAQPLPSKPHSNDIGARRRRAGKSLSVLPDPSVVARNVRPNDDDPAPPSTDARECPRFPRDGGCPERPECDNRNIRISAPCKEPQHETARVTNRHRSSER